MRRIILVMGILTLLILVVACSGQQSASNSQSPSSAATTKTLAQKKTEATPDDVVAAFGDKGLEVGNPQHVEDDPQWGTGLIPKTMDSGTRFQLPSYPSMGKEPATGDVYHFASSKDQKVVSNYFNTINESTNGGMFYTHIYETEGFLLKIDGHVPKMVAEQYGNVLKEATS